MRRETHLLLSHLAQARPRLADREGVDRRRRRIVAELERESGNSALSRELLERFAEIQRSLVADCERLRRGRR